MHCSRLKCRSSGLTWRGDYHWVQPGNLAIRRIVDFTLLRGFSAVIGWGLPLSFVPTTSRARLAYHWTFKTAHADLFEWSDSYNAGFSGSLPFQHINLRLEAFERSLEHYMNHVLPEVVP